MKAQLVLIAVLGVLSPCGVRAATGVVPARVEVVYVHPEEFSDVKDSANPTEAGREAILDAIRAYIVAEADPYLPIGCRLTMTFTDLDLAGDFEPWRGPQFDNIRIIKPIYPPAFKFTYTVTDFKGGIVKQGKENIRDLNFQEGSGQDSDPLHFEKHILSEWMRNNLKGLK
jgi:hypothetical protein